MRLGDLLLELRAELQRGVDAVDEEREPEASGPRLDVRSLEVDLPFGVSEASDGGGPDSETGPTGENGGDVESGRPARLRVTPGAGDARLTVRLGPRTEDGSGERSRDRPTTPTDATLPDGLPEIPDLIDPGDETGGSDDAGDDQRADVSDEDEREENESDEDESAALNGPIIPDRDAEVPLVAFDASVPMDRRAGAAEPVTAVEGIGQKRAVALSGIGVESVAELAARDPAPVASELATTASQAERFVERARFMDLGADAQTAEVLVDAGVAVDDLLDATPGDLHDRVRAMAGEETPVPEGYDPTQEQFERLVTWARDRRRDDT